MRTLRTALTALAIGSAVVLTACTAADPTLEAPSSVASEAPTPDEVLTPEEDGTVSESLPEGGGGAPAPTAWDEDEILGVCKEAILRDGSDDDVNAYVPSAPTATESGYEVVLESEDMSPLTCSVTGSPAEPSAVISG